MVVLLGKAVENLHFKGVCSINKDGENADKLL